MLAWPLAAYADSRVGGWRAAHSRGDFRPGRFLMLAGAYAVVGGAVLGVLSYVLIEPLFGPRYEPAKGYVLPLTLAAAVYAVARVSIATLVARRRTAWVSVAETVGFVVSLAAYVVLIPPFGAYGAAYGSLIGYGACLVATLVVLARARADERGGNR
jgi:O-antigen/teichoic acid export membrane protein